MAHENVYFESLKQVLDQTISRYCRKKQVSSNEIDRLIVQHITNTDNQHDSPSPDIDYDEPLCRIGYLYVHAGVNATLFERTINQSKDLSSFINRRSNSSLSICAVGGGPGTELLGLTKYFLLQGCLPAELEFTILDSVPHWSETWGQLADVCQSLLFDRFGLACVIHRSFQTMDTVDAKSYQNYGWLFEETDIFVYNYLLSENQIRLDDFQNAFAEMIADASSGCFFVIIDRLERNSDFRNRVTELVSRSSLQICNEFELGGGADGVVTDRETAFGEYIQRFAPRRPRRWIRTQMMKYPTAFAIVARKL